MILTDINMPEMHGLQMSERIKKIISDQRRRLIRSEVCMDTKIYAVTAMNDFQIGEVFQKYGVEAVL